MVYLDRFVSDHHARTAFLALVNTGVRRSFAYLFTLSVAAIFTLLSATTNVEAQEAMPNFSTFPTGWATDRYEPASFTNIGSYQGRTNVLAIGTDSTTDSANRPGGQGATFYNTQGRKYTFTPRIAAGRTVSAELFIPASWANEASGTVRSDLWATLVNGSDAVSAYAIIGFVNYDGGGRFRVYDGTTNTWVYPSVPVQYDSWARFSVRLEAGGNISYFINGNLVHTDTDSNGSTATKEAMLQAYNFADPTLPLPAPLSTAPYTAHWSQFSPASSRIVVTPTNTFGWSTADTRPGGATNFLADATGPAGTAALNLTTTSSTAAKAQYMHATSTPLADVTELSYFTKQNSAAFPQGAVSYQLGVYLNGTPGSFTTLVYEPYNNFPSPIVNGVWQLWDVDAGGYWSSRAVNAGGSCVTVAGGGGPNAHTLSQLKTDCPNAVVVSFGVNIGSNNPNYNVETDLVNFNGTEYDFELSGGPVVVVDDDGAQCPTPYTTISAAVAAAAPGTTISVCPGTYNESPTINKSLVLRSTGGRDVTTIQLVPSGSPGATYTGAIFVDDPAADVTIDGFSITGNDAVGSGLANSNVLIRTANSVTVTNSRMKIGAPGTGGNGDDGIGVINYYGLRTGSLTVTNSEFSPVNASGYRAFYANPGAGTFLFQNNQILGNFTSRHITEAVTSDVSNNVVTGTGASGNSGGLGVDNGTGTNLGATFRGNIVSNVSAGLWIGYYSAVNNVTATGNAFVNNDRGVFLRTAGSTNVTLNYNRIANNAVAGVANDTANPVNAENNWWGCNYGPGAGGAGCPVAANSVVGSVDASPWLTLTTTASPSSIGVGSTSTVTSRLTINSNVDDTSGIGTIPNGTPASFAGSMGTVAPSSATTANGVTGTTFTGTTPGSGGASTTVDGQTVTAPINVLSAASCVAVSAGTLNSLPGVTVDVPITAGDLTSSGALGYDTTINFAPGVLSYVGVVTAGTLSAGHPIDQNIIAPGSLDITVYTDGSPFPSGGVLLYVRFTAVGTIGTSSPITFGDFMFNEGDPCSTTTSGSVSIISGTLSGRVTYVNGPGTPPVPDVTLTGTGSSPTVSTNTDASGVYSLSGFGPGGYTVTPSKTALIAGSVNLAIGNADATRIAQYNVGLATLTPKQIIAGDVTGNGTLSNLDSTYISQWKVGIVVPGPPTNLTGKWVFLPSSRAYPTGVTTTQSGQDYEAILKGDVTGNWIPAYTDPISNSFARGSEDAVSIVAPEMVATRGANVTVPISTTNLASKGVTGYEFEVTYDPEVLEASDVAADLASTVSSGMSVAANSPEPGRLLVMVYGVYEMTGEGTLINLNFNVKGKVGSSTPIGIRNLTLNEGEIGSQAKDGSVQVVESLDPGAIRGRVLNGFGRGIPRAQISVTSSSGERFTVHANSMGRFEVSKLQLRETYTLTVTAKGYRFLPQSVSLTDNVVTLDLIAQ